MKGKNRNLLAELIRAQEEEVGRHKWFESEKAGYDIGWETAFTDWMQKHFPDWKQFHWQQALHEAYRQPTLITSRQVRPNHLFERRTQLASLETAARVLALSTAGKVKRRRNHDKHAR